MPIDKHPTGAVNSLYSQISAFNAPLAYDDEINDIYEWLFLDSGSSVEHSKTHTCPRATATYIFPQRISGQTTKKWRDQCINMWLDNCNKAFDNANRKFKGDRKRIQDVQLRYTKESLQAEFKKIFHLLKQNKAVDVNIDRFLGILMDTFVGAVEAHQRKYNVKLDPGFPVSPKDINGVLTCISENGLLKCYEEIVDLPQSRTQQSGQSTFMGPLLTMGEFFLDRPLSLSEISRIAQDALKPFIHPKAFINWYTAVLMHSGLSGKDARYILTTLMPNVKLETLIEACPTLSVEFDSPEYDDDIHPWLTQAHKQAHIAEVSDFLQKHAFKERDVTQVLNCKRKSDENVSAYANRFQNTWKDEAKLDINDTEDTFLVSMFLNGLDPRSAYTLKLSAPDLFSLSPVKLMRKIRELETVGLFNVQSSRFQAVQMDLPLTNDTVVVHQDSEDQRNVRFNMNNSIPNRGCFYFNRNKQRFFGGSRGACHYCRRQGHLIKYCLLRMQDEQRVVYAEGDTRPSLPWNAMPQRPARVTQDTQQKDTPDNLMWDK